MDILLVNFPEAYVQNAGRLLRLRSPNIQCHWVASTKEAMTALQINQYRVTVFYLRISHIDCLHRLKMIRETAKLIATVTVVEQGSNQIVDRLNTLGLNVFQSKLDTPESLLRVIDVVLTKFGQTISRLTSVEQGLPIHSLPHESTLVNAKSNESVLTPRQMQVLQVLAQGKPNKLIARELDVSENTVKAHLKMVFRVLGVSNRTEAVYQAARMQLIA